MGRALFHFERHLIVDFFRASQIKACCFRIPSFEADLPEDARVVEVHYAPEWGCFKVLVESAEFPEVATGDKYPFYGPDRFGGFEVRPVPAERID